MMEMQGQIERFEEIRSVTSSMVEAARNNDWEQLVKLERRVATLRDELLKSGTTMEAGGVLPGNERKRQLIEQIFEDDARIRRHVEPWMLHVREFLGGQRQRRKVQAAYGAADGSSAGGGRF